MCGITAISRSDPSSIPDARDFLRCAALSIESRGHDATGFGWLSPSGHPMYWKNAGTASKVVWDAPLPLGIRTAIGHTRYGTKGSPLVEANNHPVVAPGLVLVHNGVLDNDDELFRRLACKRLGKVDSEALAALLSYGPKALGLSIPELLELVEGDAAIAWLDSDTPDSLHLARLEGRPMTLAHTKRGDLVMTSAIENMRDLENEANVSLNAFVDVPEGTYMRVVAGEIVERKRFTPRGRPNNHWGFGSFTRQTVVSKPLAPKVARVEPVIGGTVTTIKPTSVTSMTDADIDWEHLAHRRGWSTELGSWES